MFKKQKSPERLECRSELNEIVVCTESGFIGVLALFLLVWRIDLRTRKQIDCLDLLFIGQMRVDVHGQFHCRMSGKCLGRLWIDSRKR